MTAPGLVVRNARIAILGGSGRVVEALAVRDGRVLAAGAERDVLASAGPSTEVLDAGGRFVMPGLHDVHDHPLLAGRADLFECTFSPQAGADEIVEAVRAAAAGTAPGEWIVGGNWAASLIPALHDPGLRSRLDEAVPDRPVMLRAASQHNRLVNAAGLALSGIPLLARGDRSHGIVRSGPEGEATGLLLESASLLAENAVRRSGNFTAERARRSMVRAIEMLHGHGITAFMDAGASRESMEALSGLDREGGLKAWAVSAMLLNDPILGADVTGDALFELGAGTRTVHHRPDFVKVFLDGVPSTKTAAFHEPYLCSPGEATTGQDALAYTAAELAGLLTRCVARGLGAKIHCTGDAAVSTALDAIAAVRAAGGAGSFHIAHGQYVRDADLDRFARLQVTADISPPLWFPNDIQQALTAVLDPALVSRVHPNRALLDRGVTLAGGSDWPVSESASPWPGIQGLVTRADPSGRFAGTLWPEQAISVAEAVDAYTTASARAMGLAGVTGSLLPGSSADFVVLDRDPFTAAPESLADVEVLQTWFAGELVFARS